MAGMLEMPWWRFTFWNVLGALLFVAVWGLGTWWLDRDIGRLRKLLEPRIVDAPFVVVHADIG